MPLNAMAGEGVKWLIRVCLFFSSKKCYWKRFTCPSNLNEKLAVQLEKRGTHEVNKIAQIIQFIWITWRRSE